MSLLSLISDLLRNIRQQKLRTVLTIFGIMWGTATLIILLAFGFGFRDQMTTNMRGMGDEIVIVFQNRTTKPFQGYGIGRPIRFREADAWYLQEQVRGIKHIIPEYSRSLVPISYNGKQNSPNVGGVYPIYGEMRNIFPQPGGRWINDRDIQERRRVVFLGDKIKDILFGDEDAVGKTVLINQAAFTVIGVMEPKTQNSSYTSRDESRTFIPATTFSTMFGTDRIANIIYTPLDITLAAQVREDVRIALARRHLFDPTDVDAVGIWDTTEYWEFMHYFFVGLNGFFAMIGLFTLAVGGIGVANIMFVVVQERMKEIGIRRSIGATRRNILSQFFAETLLLVSMGAITGYLLGWLIVQAMQHIPIKEFVGTPQFTPVVGLVAFAVLALVGLASGLLPALRASRLNIIDCLRSS